MFGFFESVDDPEVAAALLDAAERLAAPSAAASGMLGPMDFTTNDECGILIEGYDAPAMILEPWHPPYYQRAARGARATARRSTC